MNKLLYTVAFLAFLSPGALLANTCPLMEIDVTCETSDGCFGGPTELEAVGYNWQGIGCIYISPEQFRVRVSNPNNSKSVCENPDLLTLISMNVETFQGYEIIPKLKSWGYSGTSRIWGNCNFEVFTSAPFQ